MEFKLSKERRFDAFVREFVYPESKVKEFIRLLKEELKEITFVNQIPEFDEIVGDSIDKLAGDLK